MRKNNLACLAAILLASGCGQQGGQSSVELQSAIADEQARSFYEARGWKTAWSDSAAEQLIATIKAGVAHGLDPRSFLDQLEGKEGAAREAALTQAALSFAGALAHGKVDPSRLWNDYTLPKPQVDLGVGLNEALESGAVADWLGSLAPQDDEYRALSNAYLQTLRQLDRKVPQIEEGAPIKPGARDSRIPTIRSVLIARGYLGGSPQTDAKDVAYSPEMAAAVSAVQKEYGLDANSVLDRATIEALNVGPAERARQLMVNLERRRWLERTAASTRIDVNTAAAELQFWNNGNRADHRAVVVGQPEWETPQLQSPIFRLVANPSWTVPTSIEEEEIAPKGDAYMRRNNMVRRDGRIVQLPGPDNALGQVKFDMRNDHAIYLHDTPAKQLFARPDRHFSHGCVRVQDALGFARLLAGMDGKSEAFQRALASGDETFVNLDREIPVRLLYHTVYLSSDGKLVFRLDPYGWDDVVAHELGLGESRRRSPTEHLSDMGP